MPFAATWMDLKIVILRAVSQKKTNAIWYHLYVESKKECKLFSKQIQKTNSLYSYASLCSMSNHPRLPGTFPNLEIALISALEVLCPKKHFSPGQSGKLGNSVFMSQVQYFYLPLWSSKASPHLWLLMPPFPIDISGIFLIKTTFPIPDVEMISFYQLDAYTLRTVMSF